MSVEKCIGHANMIVPITMIKGIRKQSASIYTPQNSISFSNK